MESDVHIDEELPSTSATSQMQTRPSAPKSVTGSVADTADDGSIYHSVVTVSVKQGHGPDRSVDSYSVLSTSASSNVSRSGIKHFRFGCHRGEGQESSNSGCLYQRTASSSFTSFDSSSNIARVAARLKTTQTSTVRYVKVYTVKAGEVFNGKLKSAPK